VVLRSSDARRYFAGPLLALPNVTSPHKALLCFALAACAVVAGLGRPAPAAAAPPCWKALLNDWYDGRIDSVYARHCYQEALKHLPDDIDTYSSARDDILRALQSARANARRSGVKLGPNARIVPTATTSETSGSTTTTNAATTATTATTTPTTTTVATGRKQQKGLSGLADDLNPNKPSSLPLPLLVLGGLAIVLVAAGATGLVVKRVQERRSQP
jgi:hypothetical protein